MGCECGGKDVSQFMHITFSQTKGEETGRTRAQCIIDERQKTDNSTYRLINPIVINPKDLQNHTGSVQ